MRTLRKRVVRFLLASLAIGVVASLGFLSGPKQERRPSSEKKSLYLLSSANRHFTPPDSEKLVFPKDHGPHPRSGIETWQVIGYLETRDAKHFGFDATFTRVDLDSDPSRRKSAWAADQIYHLSYGITPFGESEAYRDRETARYALGLAGFDAEKRKIRVYRRTLQFKDANPELPRLELDIPDSAYPAKLEFLAVKPPVIPSLSAPFRYYTVSRLKVEGTMKIAGRDRPVSGQGFFSHIWGNLPLAGGQLVRNRFVLQLSNNTELNLLQTQRRDGTGKSIETGLVISADSETNTLEQGDLHIEPKGHWTSPASGIRYPLGWRIRIPENEMVIDLKPWSKNRESGEFPINWSVMVSVTGHAESKPVSGLGYVQLSGYLPPEDQ